MIFQELVSALQDLEQSLQEDTTLPPDHPPGFFGDSLMDSPETMSINSELASHHMDSGLEDDDNLSTTQQGEADARGKSKNGEFSLESALFSVAVKAKRFAEERRSKRKFTFPSFRSPSADSQKDNDEVDNCGLKSQDESVFKELGQKGSLGTLDTKVDSSNKEEQKVVAKDVNGLQLEDSDNDSRGDDEVDVK